MTDQRFPDDLVEKINGFRAVNFHSLAVFGRDFDQVMGESGMDLPTFFSRGASHGIRLPVSSVMAELLVRLYRQAPSWADSPDQVQLSPAPADLVELVGLVEDHYLSDLVAGLGIHLGRDEDDEEGQGQ